MRRQDAFYKDLKKGIDYKRRLAVCENVVPHLLRKVSVLNEKHLLLEEQAWLDMTTGCVHIKSHNITWSDYANMWEESNFRPLKEKPTWTQFDQHGVIEVQGMGAFGRVLELFAKQFMQHKIEKSINVMEEILKERYPPPLHPLRKRKKKAPSKTPA